MIRKISLLQVESRWLLAGIAAVAMLLVTYFFDIETMLHESRVLLADINDLREQINRESALSVSQADTIQDDYIDIGELLQFIDDKRATLQEKNEDQYRLELTMRDRESFRRFLQILMREGDKYFINDFNLSVNEAKELHLIITLAVSENSGHLNPVKLDHLSQLPLCHLPLHQQSLTDQALHYSLRDLHLLGSLRHQRDQKVLIRFPDGVTRIMNLHDRLGKESAVITKISDQSITVTLPDNQEITCEFSASCSAS